MSTSEELPGGNRPISAAAGHWVLARAGKRVLRPGGAALTTALLQHARLPAADVIEFAPGLGRTAGEIVTHRVRSYTGIDQDPVAATRVGRLVAAHGTCQQGDARATGLPTASADVVVGEAMLTMQGERGKQEIITEAVRLLRPGGRYAIHELALVPDDVDPAIASEIRGALARSIRVNARPLTVAEWSAALQAAGLEIEWSDTAPMALLNFRRNLADEGLSGVARILKNVLTNRDLRRRILAMRRVFSRYRRSLAGVAIVARKP